MAGSAIGTRAKKEVEEENRQTNCDSKKHQKASERIALETKVD